MRDKIGHRQGRTLLHSTEEILGRLFLDFLSLKRTVLILTDMSRKTRFDLNDQRAKLCRQLRHEGIPDQSEQTASAAFVAVGATY